ncbi:MAG TPA: hypothetical protein VGR35_09805 [Tepidisphaeraceae bacterium]|nr:hypothetical protein [Tepidisphaeraceae bacterium]
MDDANREPSPPSQPLEYAARLPPDVRTSRLAIASLVVAILGSPCLLGPFSDWINWYVPQQFDQVGRYGFVHFWFIRGAMILATALPVAAIIRIALSRRTRTGMTIAITALVISLLWWGMAYVAYLMWSGWRRD